MMRTISVAEAARGFADVINRVLYRRESALLIRGGKAVAKIVPVEETAKTGYDLASVWTKLEHLSPGEAEDFGHDIENARKSLPSPRGQWD